MSHLSGEFLECRRIHDTVQAGNPEKCTNKRVNKMFLEVTLNKSTIDQHRVVGVDKL